ncbi:MAG: hypothetical protein AB7K09_25340 [Planctomycetota bacterium]
MNSFRLTGRCLILTALLATMAALLMPSDAVAGGGPDIKDKDVKGTPDTIYGQPFYAVVPGTGEEGSGILISTHMPGAGRRPKPEPMDQATFDELLEKAQAFRTAKLSERKTVGWKTKVWYIKTEHFELAYDIPSIKLLGKQQVDVVGGMLEYAKRAEMTWHDWEDAFGPTSMGDMSAPLRFYMHDKAEECALTAQKINKKELRPGPTRGCMQPSTNYWERQSMPTDNDLWENFTHFVAGQMASQYRGVGRYQMSIPAWLDEGIAYYFTRIHREMDTHTTIIFEEQLYETAAHIDGNAWKGHAKKVADAMNDDAVKAIFTKAKSNLTQDERILGWAIICYMIDYSKERSGAILKGLDADKSKDVSLEEWLADPRHDADGDLVVGDAEKATAEREFQEWDLDQDGVISVADEAKAHMFRQYLQLQKTRNGNLEHEEALQRAFGWTNQDMLDRVRAWINGKPFIDKANTDWSLYTDWKKYAKDLQKYCEEMINDEMKVARAIMSLGRWSTPEAVAQLYDILEYYEKLLDQQKIQRPLKIYEAAQRIVANYSDERQLQALFDCLVDGKIGRAKCDDVVVRNTMLRGLGKNRAGGNINQRLARVIAGEDWSLRVAALDTLGERGLPLGADSVVDAVVAALKSDNRAVRAAAAQCIPKLSNKSDQRKFLAVLDALVAAFEKENGAVRDDIYNALKDITGDDVGPTYNRWADWARLYRVAVNRGEKNPMPKVDPAPSDPGGTRAAGPPPEFGGDRINAQRIVFVLDRSHSMTERLENKEAVITGMRKKRERRAVTTGASDEDAKKQADDDEKRNPIDWSKVQTKWDLARESLISTLKAMAEEHKAMEAEMTGGSKEKLPERYFTVLLFDHRVWIWNETMVPATKANVEKAIAWVSNQPDPNSNDREEKWGLTNIYDAIAAALEITTGEQVKSNNGKPKDGPVITDTGERRWS